MHLDAGSSPAVQYDAEAHADVDAALRAGAATAKVSEFGAGRRLRRGPPPPPARHTAPEVAEGSRLHLAADVYSFGVLMWELLAAPPQPCALILICDKFI
jgi:Protein tyrosine and serine/threonine kinase